MAEANRDDGFCSHVDKPRILSWWLGSKQAVTNAVHDYMQKPVPVRRKNGAVGIRRQRSDHRCLVAGVVSWPDPIQWFLDHRDMERRDQGAMCFRKSLEWLHSQFEDSLIAAVTHADEEYPHLHFFCVGDANDLHPGLRAEFSV